MRRVLAVFALSLVLAAAFLADAATAWADPPPQVCLSDSAKSPVTACPAGARATAVQGGRPPLSFHATVESLKTAVKRVAVGTASVSPIIERDPRQLLVHLRVLALLVTEIQQLESLLKATSTASADRPLILRRLAEDYVALEIAASREKTEAEIKRDALRSTNPREAGRQQAIATSRSQTVDRSRKAAVGYYTTLVNEYAGQPSPAFPSNPPAPYALLDEAYYYLAYEYEQASDAANARRVYLELITRTPASRFVVNAYLAFGELFFNEALGDPDRWEPAKQAYIHVIARPPPDNKLYGYAWYKLAYVFWNQGDLAHALDAFKKTIDYGAQFSQLPNATKLAESARKDIVAVYALAGSPTEAYAFFRNLGPEPFAMMNDLGQSYLDTGHYPEAITLYRDLGARDSGGDRVCDYQSHVTEATMALKSGDKTAIVQELNQQLRRYASYQGERHPDEAKHRCANRTAAMATETAMAWHVEAVGSQGQRGTGDARTLDLASLLYKKVAGTWDAATFSKFEFPRLVKDDWPTIYKIKYDLADLLYFRERWEECGAAFDAVADDDPKGQDADNAAYASVLCHFNAYLGSHPGGTGRAVAARAPAGGRDAASDPDAIYRTKDMTDAQRSMVRSFDRYVCGAQPARMDTNGRKQLGDVKFARCRLYFEAQHWQEAAACFRDIAFADPPDDGAVDASRLYLESLNVLAKHGLPNRESCVDDMVADVPKLHDRFCTGDGAQKNEEACVVYAKVQCDGQRMHAQKLVELADQGGSDAVALFERGAREYLELWEKYGATPLRAGVPSQCERLDEVVENAARAFQAAHLVASAIRARMVLVDPAFRMDGTELAKDAVLKIGGNWQAVAVYDQAADWYERYARSNPRRAACVGGAPCAADKTLSDAIVLRLGLGQQEQAAADVKQYEREYGSSNAIEAAQIAFAVGAHLADTGDWEGARKALSGAMRTLDKAAPDLQIEAHATYARALRNLRSPQAAAQYREVRQLWGDGSAARARLAAAYPGEGEEALARRLGKTLDAVGEAIFYAAEEMKLRSVDSMPFPLYGGPGTRDDVLRFVDQKLEPWVAKKRAVIEAVEREYQKVTELAPVPPPRWVIAAASRAGMMWGDFVDDFRRAPYPRDWDRQGFVPGTGSTLAWSDLRASYIENIARASEPIKRDKARPALRRCLDDSVKYQYFDDFSRACEQWLARTYKAEYHVVDELRGAPTLSNGGLDDRPPPLVAKGQLWHALSPAGAVERVEIVGAEGSGAKKPLPRVPPKRK